MKVTPTQKNCRDMIAWVKNDMVSYNKGIALEATALRNRITRMSGSLLVDDDGRGHFLTLTKDEAEEHRLLERTFVKRSVFGILVHRNATPYSQVCHTIPTLIRQASVVFKWRSVLASPLPRVRTCTNTTRRKRRRSSKHTRGA